MPKKMILVIRVWRKASLQASLTRSFDLENEGSSGCGLTATPSSKFVLRLEIMPESRTACILTFENVLETRLVGERFKLTLVQSIDKIKLKLVDFSHKDNVLSALSKFLKENNLYDQIQKSQSD